MSFILDALKKSETERQQQSTAEFAAVPSRSGTPTVPRWLWVVAALLVINLAVLLSLYLRHESEAEAFVKPPAPIEKSSIEALPIRPDEEPSFADRVATAQRNIPSPQAEDVVAQTPPPSEPAVMPVIISHNPATVSSAEVYPTIHEVRASGTMTLPELHLDIHVYSEAAEDRFVFINMSKHREGSQLAEGPLVAEIRPDGVVLDHLGQSFLLPRE